MTDPLPGDLGPPPGVRPLHQLSPSHAPGLDSCALREVWSSARLPSALPPAPSAAVGTVAHRLLEQAGRGDFAGTPDASIATRWDELLNAADAECGANWLTRHLVPLAAAVPDYEVRRLQAIAGAVALTRAVESARTLRSDHMSGRLPAGAEVPVVTPDGRAGGRIDVVAPTAAGPILKDYKTGAIFGRGSNAGAVKPEYVVQLKLYAAIYAAMTGQWPAGLEVAPVAGEPERIPFTPEECDRLLAHGVERMDEVNQVIADTGAPFADQLKRLAAPAPSVCGYCAYRPYCGPYEGARTQRAQEPWPLDTSGTLVELILLGNGKRLLTLAGAASLIHVRGIYRTHGRHPALDRATVGDTLRGYNLRPGGSPTSFTEGPFTTFYRTDPGAGGGPSL